MSNEKPTYRFLAREGLQSLFDELIADGYDVVGPTVEDEAIVYRRVRSVDELPYGVTEDQRAGSYRLQKSVKQRYFYFNSTPDSWKKYLFPARHEIGRATLDDDGWHFEQTACEETRLALVGVRACDLAAIAIQDRIFMEGDYVDPGYAKRREAALIVAVNCSTAAPTCFCSSMNTGPACATGFDIALTETDDGFQVEIGSAKGSDLVARLATESVSSQQGQLAQLEIARARDAISKQFDSRGVHDLLLDNLEHPQWSKVADRCLSCTNCTMVCPTCFCSTVDEVSNLHNTDVRRVRSWDSCFNLDISYTAGGTIHNSIRSRYRQWLTHKLATWEDQFDVSGCTGCGRCISWCPVGIDLTEEVAAIRDSQANSDSADGATA